MALLEFIQTGTSLKLSESYTNINERVRYTANTGTGVVSVANTNRNGTGTLVDVFTTGLTTGSVGTLIKTITIKARANATRGMIRLLVFDGTNTRLIEEFDVSAVVQVGIQATFEVSYDVDWSFNPGITIRASTDKAESFAITVQGLDLTYP